MKELIADIISIISSIISAILFMIGLYVLMTNGGLQFK